MERYYKLVIEETTQNTLKDKPIKFNKLFLYFDEIKEVEEYLIKRYRKLPKITNNNKIYTEDKNNKSVEIGFTYSYWNNDISHNTKKWFQTDWICIFYLTCESYLLRRK